MVQKIMFTIVHAFKHIFITLEGLIVIHLILLVTFKEQECNLYLLEKLFSTRWTVFPYCILNIFISFVS